jgi:protein ImuB
MDDIPLVPAALPARFETTMELEWPVDGLEPFSFLLARVLEPLGVDLRNRGRRAAGLSLELGLADGTFHCRTLRFASPSSEPRTWRSLLLLDLEAHPPREAIRTIRVLAEPAPARSVQLSLLDPAQPCPERLAETLARLQGRAGAACVGAATLLDTHRPGAFALGAFAPGPFVARRPERGQAPRVALRAFRPPLPAKVAVREGVPVSVAAACARGDVVDRAGPWRASGDWWEAPWSREEWDVAMASGVYRIFRDRSSGSWFVEGELD